MDDYLVFGNDGLWKYNSGFVELEHVLVGGHDHLDFHVLFSHNICIVTRPNPGLEVNTIGNFSVGRA